MSGITYLERPATARAQAWVRVVMRFFPPCAPRVTVCPPWLPDTTSIAPRPSWCAERRAAGKSLLTTALARYYARQDLKVAPFKAQNMSNNARVVDQGEMGSAQYLQALAARRIPDVRMNPVLLKPESDIRSQVVVLGRREDRLAGLPWRQRSKELWPTVSRCLAELLDENDLVVIEGAGSPAEINLQETDIVNLRIAETAGAATLDLASTEARRRYFAAAMSNLGPEQLQIFWDVYADYEKEKDSIAMARTDLAAKYLDAYRSEGGLQDAELTQLVRDASELQKKSTDLRLKYFGIYSQRLNTKAAARFALIDDYETTAVRMNLFTKLPLPANAAGQ